jgi:hypothetical protein
MRHYSFQRNIVWIALFSILLVVTLNACSDSNNVTGPPPPVPLSPDAKLSSLTINTGPLDPVFSSDVVNYTEDVATSVNNVTVTARPQNANASMTIDGQATASGQARTISLGAAGSSTPIPIVVTAVNGSQNTYIVTVRRAPPGGNNNLQSLTVSPGPLAPPFAATTTNYTVDVATSVTSVTVTARAQDAGATVNIDGQTTTSRSVSLAGPGSNTPIPIEVTAPNGSQKTYLVTVRRAAPGGNNNLQSLAVSPGPLAPPFTANTTSYTVNVASTVNSVTVTATLQDTNASMTVNGQGTSSGQARTISLNGPGSNTPIPIEVTAPNGNQKTYLVTVNQAALGGNNNLQSLAVSPGPLAPPFTANTTSYTVDVANSVTNVTVTARAQDAGATVSINNQTTSSLSIPLGAAGTNTPIQVEVTAPNGSQKTYVVNVNRAALGGNNNLQSLSVSPGSLAPGFTPNTRSYTVNVADSVDSVTVLAQAQDAGATVSIENQTTTSLSVPLEPAGTTTLVSIDVTAPNGNQKTYTVRVNRAAPIPPPTITTTSLPNGNVNTFYSQQLAATGGSGNLTWTSTGSLPDGLNMDAAGLISGTPTLAGPPIAFSVQVTDALQQSDTQDLSIEIFAGP